MFFRKKCPQSPLSDLCGKCSQEFIANFIQSGDLENELARAELLSYLIMYGAEHFITRDLDPDKSEIWFNHESIVTDSNKDVLMAETIVWLGFLIGRLWKSDKEYEGEWWKREAWATLPHTNKLLVSIISDLTKVDFHNRAIEGRRLYLDSEKVQGDLSVRPETY